MMKKIERIRRVLAVLMAAVLMMGLSVNVSAAEGVPPTSSIIVTSDSEEFAVKTVTAIQMFSATVNTDGGIAYTLKDEFKDFFTTDDQDKYGCSGKEGQELSDAAYAYIQNLVDPENPNDKTQVTAFAAEVLEYIRKKAGLQGFVVGQATASLDETSGKYTAEITDLQYGYYLVYPDDGANSSTRKTNAQLISLASDIPEKIELKSEYPTVDKKIIEQTNGNDSAADVKIGDTITFTLTSKVPDMSEYTAYAFKFTDTLSEGLTFNSDSVKVSIDGIPLTSSDDYTVINPTTNNNTLEIELKTLFSNYSDKAGTPIVVTYTATLNENAVITQTTPEESKNTNSAKVDYSYTNNAGTKGSGSSTPDVVTVHTFDFTIDKYTGDTYNEGAKRLAGAKFELKDGAAENAATYNLIKVSEGNGSDPAVYRMAKDGEIGDTVTTPASGKVQIKGLSGGTYYLYETEAPKGYNKLAAPLKVTITPAYDPNTKQLTGVTVTYDENTPAETGNIVPVKNNTGTVLPSTGGLGTMLLTVFGVALVIFGVFRFSKKSKASSES